LRMLGGATNHWARMGNPLAKMDFEKRSWVPHSGWPITRDDLEPFYARAVPYMGWASMEFSPEYWEAKVDSDEFNHLPLLGGDFDSSVFQYREPTRRFSLDFKDKLESAKNLHVYLHANVTQFEVSEDGGGITAVKVQSLGHDKFEVKARIFILATGGIENARMLLASNQVQKAGIGNDHDVVGRYFMEHTRLDCGPVLPIDRQFLHTYHYHRAVLVLKELSLRLRFVIRSTPEFQRDSSILNLHANLRREFLENDATGVALRGVLDDLHDGKPGIGERVVGNVKGMVRAVRDSVSDNAQTEKGPEALTFIVHGEQAPNPDSRITLADEKDALGIPRTRIDWRFTDLDRRSFHVVQQAFAKALGMSGLGRQRNDLPMSAGEFDALAAEEVEYHHIGTTRMNTDPKQGVVDQNCQVHGVDNLYIAGSSVFPTAGAANPTFTILALTLRLADHLKQVVKAAPDYQDGSAS